MFLNDFSNIIFIAPKNFCSLFGAAHVESVGVKDFLCECRHWSRCFLFLWFRRLSLPVCDCVQVVLVLIAPSDVAWLVVVFDVVDMCCLRESIWWWSVERESDGSVHWDCFEPTVYFDSNDQVAIFVLGPEFALFIES